MKNQNQTVILVHGIFDNGNLFARMKQALEAIGLVVYTIDLKPSGGLHGIEPLAAQLKRLVDSVTSAGDKIGLVGFSMGGIVARYYVQRLGGLDKVQTLVLIASPNFGTYLSYLLPLKSCRQMRKGSAFLKSLNAESERLKSVAPVCLWTRYDLMIVPSSSSILGVGDAYQIPVLLHRFMPSDVRVIAVVAEHLRPSPAE